MNLEDLRSLEDDAELVNRLYSLFDEDARLNRSPGARVEFLTTVRYIERYLSPGHRILDVGAGAGEYSPYIAKQGYAVWARELANANVAAFRRKLTPELAVDLVQGNALDLSRYPDASFDIVLLFGPLYHLHKEEDKRRCLAEAKRVLKNDGTLFVSYIANDFVFLTEFSYDPQYFLTGDYDKETFRLNDFPFVFHTVDDCRRMLDTAGIDLLHAVASDGICELMEEKIAEMREESYQQFLRYHFYLCEKPEFLGMTNHLLFVGRKRR